MLFSASTAFLLASTMAGLVWANPAKREVKFMDIYFCNSCIGTSAGDTCTQDFYSHISSGQGDSCEDKSVPFSPNACSAYGKISTPYGDGYWTALSDCTGTSGTKLRGVISQYKDYQTQKGWECTCANTSGTFDEQCAKNYACQYTYQCYCSPASS